MFSLVSGNRAPVLHSPVAGCLPTYIKRAITPLNSYTTIEARSSEAFDTIHDSWYSTCIQAATVYEVPIRQL